ncbi:hypothetical protein GGR56DRAFT_137542 [Xylariaceae sp. FL0804]|nr:hypothetical protein GGR56DRAFT_137542 [Xylariaceae sp. FL0804]
MLIPKDIARVSQRALLLWTWLVAGRNSLFSDQHSILLATSVYGFQASLSWPCWTDLRVSRDKRGHGGLLAQIKGISGSKLVGVPYLEPRRLIT